MGEDYLRHKDVIYRIRAERCCEAEFRQLRLGQQVSSMERAEVAARINEPIQRGELIVLAFLEPGTATMYKGRQAVGQLSESAAMEALAFADGLLAVAAAVELVESAEGECRIALFKQKAS